MPIRKTHSYILYTYVWVHYQIKVYQVLDYILSSVRAQVDAYKLQGLQKIENATVGYKLVLLTFWFISLSQDISRGCLYKIKPPRRMLGIFF